MSRTIPEEMKKLTPMNEVLLALQFHKNELGCFKKAYGALELSACPWLTGWVIIGFYATHRTIRMPEFRVPDKLVPIELLATIYSIWQDNFRGESPPTELLPGKEHYEYKKNIQKLLPPKPVLWADREFFRFCMGFIEKHNDWSKGDYDVEFSYIDGQLNISTNKTKVYCPARGTWIGSIVISGRQLFRSAPKRFLGEVVVIGAEPNHLRIESHIIPAKWKDLDERQNV